MSFDKIGFRIIRANHFAIPLNVALALSARREFSEYPGDENKHSPKWQNDGRQQLNEYNLSWKYLCQIK